MKSFDIKTKIYFGDQALDRLAEIPYQKVLVVTDPFIAHGELIDLVTEPLKKGNKQFEIFKDVVPDPPIEKISEGKDQRRRKEDARLQTGCNCGGRWRVCD